LFFKIKKSRAEGLNEHRASRPAFPWFTGIGPLTSGFFSQRIKFAIASKNPHEELKGGCWALMLTLDVGARYTADWFSSFRAFGCEIS
jgi:hypothetical protein